MKRNLLTLLAILLTGLPALAEDHENWITNFEEAKRIATEKNLPILANFAGSDWCGWCMKLDAEVFTQKAFIEFARQNLVLFLADFPMQKPQSEADVRQNRELQARYGVEGFPTVLVLDAAGKPLARTGYRNGGAEAYVEHLKTLLNQRDRS